MCRKVYTLTLLLLVLKQVYCRECKFASKNGNAAFKVVFDEMKSEMKIYLVDQGEIDPREILVVDHSASSSGIYVGSGRTTFLEYRGNFDITDYTTQKIPLRFFEVRYVTVEAGETTHDMCQEITFRNLDANNCNVNVTGLVEVNVTFVTTSTTDEGVGLVIGGKSDYDRVWIRFSSDLNEKVYGGGEQFSFFNMKGKCFPIWTREQGVGRNKNTNITFLADVNDGGAGGDYHTTYWPQPLFYTDKKYSVGMTSSKYSVFDFSQEDFHEVEVWEENDFQFDFNVGYSWPDIVAKTTKYLIGETTKPRVPEWSYNAGAILGLQGGTEVVMEIYDQAIKNNVTVSGIWIQDWVGQIKTSFGTRLFWDWKLDEERYPNIRQIMAEEAAKGVYFTAYINPYLNYLGELYEEASGKGYLVKIQNGSNHLSDFGEFYCGTVDLTYPAAFAWYKEKIKVNLIDVGFRGWMADFGEYMPIADQVFHNGRSPAELHNLWPSLWAQVNREAIQERGMSGKIFVWMRAGHTESAKHMISGWAGDQNVDWSMDDGLISVVPAALSLGMSGTGVTHHDIGGFTSLFGVVRTQELLFRSAELAVFTPTMRTHEGNRPAENWQIYSDDFTFGWFGRLTQLHKALSNYTTTVIQQYYASSIPAQRPMFFECPTDYRCYDDLISKDQYMFGEDLLVAPIYTAGDTGRKIYFPAGSRWISIWDDQDFVDTAQRGDYLTKNGKMGEPPVYYRSGSGFESLFKSFQDMRAPEFTPNRSSCVKATYLSSSASLFLLICFTKFM